MMPRTLYTEIAFVEQVAVGVRTLVDDAKAFLNPPSQVGHRPQRTPQAIALPPELLGGVAVQHLQNRFNLLRLELGVIPAQPVVQQARDPLLTIGAAPYHQTRATTTADRLNLTDLVALPIQTYRLESTLSQGLVRVLVRTLQFVDCFRRKDKSSSVHPPIVYLLLALSIRCIASVTGSKVSSCRDQEVWSRKAGCDRTI